MTDADDNVAVVLTPPGLAAIAVVRLCGPLNAAFAAAHLSRMPKVGRCVHADVRVAQVDAPTCDERPAQVGVPTGATHAGGTAAWTTLDDVVVVRTPAGHLDLNLHGGTWVVASMLQLVERFGYRVADWTIADGAIDAEDDIERQMLLDLPRALSPAVLKMLTAQPAAWRAMLEADDRDAMRRAVADTTLAIALAVPGVAVVGPPNVGKSTLANALAGTERSITADAAGTTRDWVGGLADLDGVVVRLVDTPGIRPTADAIEAAAIERASDVIAAAGCVVVAFDGSRSIDDAERDVIERFASSATIVVRTKSDRPLVAGGPADAISVCALSGQGLSALRAAVWRSLGVSDLAGTHARCWTDGQRDDLRRRLDLPAASNAPSAPYNPPDDGRTAVAGGDQH